jgi:hypothetical protein
MPPPTLQCPETSVKGEPARTKYCNRMEFRYLVPPVTTFPCSVSFIFGAAEADPALFQLRSIRTSANTWALKLKAILGYWPLLSATM